MRLAFVIQRKNYYRLLGPAVEEEPAFASELVHNLKPGWIYNWPGVAYGVPLREAFDGFGRWGLADFPLDSRARSDYVERFLGFDDGRSSERLLDLAAGLAPGSR